MASGYGYRIHPDIQNKKISLGDGFSAPKGTPIYATGNGKVEKVKRSRRGFGNHVKIDHGLDTKRCTGIWIAIRFERTKSKRGDVIGYVGTSGTSTAPHLHYEVVKGKRKVNPVYYYFNDLTPEEYDKMLEMASTRKPIAGLNEYVDLPEKRYYKIGGARQGIWM